MTACVHLKLPVPSPLQHEASPMAPLSSSITRYGGDLLASITFPVGLVANGGGGGVKQIEVSQKYKVPHIMKRVGFGRRTWRLWMLSRVPLGLVAVQESYLRCINDYSSSGQWLGNLMQAPPLRLRGHRLRVEPAEEPTAVSCTWLDIHPTPRLPAAHAMLVGARLAA